MSVTNFQTRLKRNCGYNQYTVVQNKPSYNKGLKKALRNYIFLLLLLFTPDARTIYTRAHIRACTYNIYCYMNSTSSTVKYKGAYIRVGKMLFCTGHLITMKKKKCSSVRKANVCLMCLSVWPLEIIIMFHILRIFGFCVLIDIGSERMVTIS